MRKIFLIPVFTIFLGCGKSDTNVSSFKIDEATNFVSNAAVSETVRNVSLADFIQNYSENGFASKTKSISELTFNLSYVPKEILAAIELKREKYDLEKFSRCCLNYENLIYFKLKCSAPSAAGEILKYRISSPGQYDERVKFISFEMQSQLSMIQKDTLLPCIYQYERIFNVAPFYTVMFAFPKGKIDLSKEFTIAFNDMLFDKGSIKFNYKPAELLQLPKVTEL